MASDTFREELRSIGSLTSSDVAAELDRRDPLAPMREEYLLPKLRAITGASGDQGEQPALYFCGNSLGPLTKRSRALINEELDVWAERGVNGHFDHPHERPWWKYEVYVARLASEIVGAKPLEVAVLGSLTSNIHLLLSTFYRPLALPGGLLGNGSATRHKILYEHCAFPSDSYALQSVCRLNNLDPATSLVPLHPREGEATLRTEDILQAIRDAAEDGALIMLGGIQYLTGQLFDIPAITAAAHEVGMLAGFDLAHAFANVPLALHDWDVDFAAWCSYKYGCAGPGGIAGIFIHERWCRRPDIPRPAGWWGNEPSSRFAMKPSFEQQAGAAGWQLSNPSILDLASLRGSLEVLHLAAKYGGHDHTVIGTPQDAEERNLLETVGYGRVMPTLREKSERLTAYLLLLLGREAFAIEDLGLDVQIITPTDPAQRGSQVCVRIRDSGSGDLLQRAFQLAERKHGLVGDVRKPDVLRLAPLAHYTTYTEVFRAAESLRWALEAARAAE
ncbi:kynureninase [Malassezia cuniculi]|uniref:Kynureninase n=1 Tax=Malassezia cuniculi TaxID=948313 RepID=A0AAF0ENN3_9BASI|nr:kynureninase [Malassezia cuniculi]